MRRITLPAIRLSRVQERVGQIDGMTYEKVAAVMQIIEDELEVGARRVGSLCPKPGCSHILQQNEEYRWRSMFGRYVYCADHGYIDSHDGLSLVIAFDPIKSVS